ncbi:hypothetical protein [Agrobacterium pusense]|uniref:hypothetical protein n=1 Tax=Agrobacterium pusense TaxID=648995 RepID=UPI002FDE8353
MSKRKGQNNGSTTRNQTTPAASGNASEIDAAGAPPSADGAALDATSLVDGPNGVDGAADGKGLSDGSENASAGSSTNAHSGDAGHNVSGDIGTGSGSGSIENDGDASADGAADGGKDGSVSDNGGDGQSRCDASSHDRDIEHVGDGNKDEDVGGKDLDGKGVSPDLKAALELAGFETAEDLIDMARVGSNLMGAIDDIRRCEGQFKDWAPADDPVEIVHDLYAALEHAWEKADALKQSAPEDDKPWWLEMPNLAEGVDPLEISRFVARDVFVGVHGSVEVLGALIRSGQPIETPAIPFEALSGLVDLVRKIGPRATPDVMAQHLVITKHRQSADLTKAEELSLKAFAAILIDLDDFAASEKKRLEKLAAETPKPRPVPIDETNMELVDGPMATH